jgi:two-component system, response regulator
MQGIIVLVEDSADDEELTRRALRRNNIANEVVVLRDGVEAVDYLCAEDRPTVSVVLLDLKLPRLGGLEVLERVRGHPRSRLTPVVVLTSSDEEEDLVRSYGLGANSYIRKPVDFDRFMEAIRLLGLYWLMVNRPPPES